MTPKGHIALDSREYVLSDYRQYRQMLGNQMALPGTQGTSEFRSLDSWDALNLSDFTQGVGLRDVAAGGYHYAEATANWPNHLMPLPLPTYPHVFHATDAVDAYQHTVGVAGQPLLCGWRCTRGLRGVGSGAVGWA